MNATMTFWFWLIKGAFPLTPALSLGERENRFPSHKCRRFWICEAVFRTTANRRRLFPLPKGEGQGEGKSNAQTFVV